MQYDRSTKKDPLSDEYKSFLNSLNLNINIVETIDINHHASDCLSGWMGLKSLVCSSEDRATYEIDLSKNTRVVKKETANNSLTVQTWRPKENVASNCWKFSEITYLIRNRYFFISNYPFIQGESILKCLVNPANQKFDNFLNLYE